MLDIILEEAWKTVREYWQTVGLLISFGIASAVLLAVDGEANALQGFGIMLLIAAAAIAILAICFLAVRVFSRMRE